MSLEPGNVRNLWFSIQNQDPPERQEESALIINRMDWHYFLKVGLSIAIGV